MNTFKTILRRDLALALRRAGELANPLLFYVIVASLFPLALSPEAAQLRSVGPGIVWVSALLSSLLALEGVFRGDVDDGSMEQMLLGPGSPLAVVAAKLAAHWIVSGAPLLLLAPLLALMFYLPMHGLPALLGALLLATPALSVLSAIAAALTVSLRTGGALAGLLVLPLTVPVLIFGARATDLAIDGEPVRGPLYLLAAIAVLAITLGPFATAAALKVSME